MSPGKDYSSFSSVAKSRFRAMAQELGYEQLSGTAYAKEREGWFEAFVLQAAQFGNEFFYINFGISVPNLWEPFKREVDTSNLGFQIKQRLHNDDDQGFPSTTKAEVEGSARIALEKYREQAIPWFDQFSNLEDISARYFENNSLDHKHIGNYSFMQSLSVANYGLLLFKASKTKDAIEWLCEADRLYSLDDELEDDEIEQQETIRNLIKYLQSA